MKRFHCTVPWLDGRPLINATATTESEAWANVGLLDLSEEQLARVELREADLTVKEPEVVR